MKKTAGRRSFYALFCLRARDGEFRAPARVTFFCCQKKVTKENHLDLRSKGPLARYGSCKIGGADLAELVRRGTLSVRGIACTACAAAADAVRVGAGTLVVFGDYQIAPIAARSTAMGRWRLTPPWYWGTLPAGGTGDERPLIRQLRWHLSPCGSVRGSDTPPACHSTPRAPQGEG